VTGRDHACRFQQLVVPTVAIHAIDLARCTSAGLKGSGPHDRLGIGLVGHLRARRASLGGTTEDGPSHQKASRCHESELVHPHRDHPRRELIKPEAERQGEAGRGADEGAEDEQSLRNGRETHADERITHDRGLLSSKRGKRSHRLRRPYSDI
jgi:hypothetical protein